MSVTDQACGARTWLKVCISCDRYASPDSETYGLGRRLADETEAALLRQAPQYDNIELRRVHCLSGCRHPGNIVIGAIGRAKLRFHSVDCDQVDALLTMANACMRSVQGMPEENEWLDTLKPHLAGIDYPRSGDDPPTYILSALHKTDI